MLEEVRIRGLGVIDDATLTLGAGLTVVTGETGAGKTMVVTALALLLGARADSGSVRAALDGALVEGRVQLAHDSPVTLRAREAGAELDDGALLVTRSVGAAGRSRAWLGGRAVPVGVLAELAEGLAAVHGQADQQALRSPARQRDLLDRWAGLGGTGVSGSVLGDYRAAYQRMRRVARELAEVTEHVRERAAEAELLRLALREVERVAPQPGEDVALDTEEGRLANAEDLRLAAVTAHAALAGDPDSVDPVVADVGGLLAAARRVLEAASVHDTTLGQAAARVAEAGYLVADVAADLAAYGTGLDADPGRLAAVQNRRAALKPLLRAHGPSCDDVLAWAADAGPRLAELDADDDRVGAMRGEHVALVAHVETLAAEVTRERAAAGSRLSAAVASELAALAMPSAALHVQLVPQPAPGPDGADDVELLLVPHAGAAPRPLARGASGGELSRVMLALEVVLAGSDPTPTMVFDEVDAGVGGRAALEIGRRLARLARDVQVVVVTHLPQVAAFADRHVRVSKAAGAAGVTVSDVVTLDGEGRVRELARMMAGMEESGAAVAHAGELLALATRERR